MMELEQLYKELRFAKEGLAQMHELDAGYYDKDGKVLDEYRDALERDTRSSSEAIDRLNKKIARLEGRK